MERRSINDHRYEMFGDDPERSLALVCECADPECRRAVVLQRTEFAALRMHGTPVLFPGHRPDDGARGGAGETDPPRGDPSRRAA